MSSVVDLPPAPFGEDPFVHPADVPPEPERDQWKRRIIPDPVTGEVDRKNGWTAVTTFLGALKDAEGLIRWTGRQIVTGIGAREDLYALAAAADPADTKALDRVVEKAKDAAGSYRGANLGTALHGFTERRARGEVLDVPGRWRDGVEAYEEALKIYALTPEPEYLERMVVIPKYHLVGRIDGALRLADGTLAVSDTKTKQSIKSWYEEACQLALYALATHFWDEDTRQLTPCPVWNQRVGVIMHMPAGQGYCRPYWANLDLGRKVAQLAHGLRVMRGMKNFVRDMDPVTPVSPIT